MLEEIKQEVENRRFRLGPIRLIPIFQLSNAGYDSNVLGTSENEVADWTATVSAGLRWIVPLGSKVYLHGNLLPQYIWYKDLTERRAFGGNYRASLSGFFNRLTLEGTGYRERASDYLSSELETRVLRDVEDGALNLELDVTRKIALFGGAEARRLRYTLAGVPPVEGLDVRRLDRTDGVARVGIRFGISPQFSLTGAVEGSQTVFDDEEEQERRDNRTFAYLGGLFYSRPRLFLNLTGGFREGRAYRGSSFREFSTATGSYFASYFLRRNLEAQLYGARRLVYGILDSPYYFETRNGGGLNYQFRPRFLLRGFAEYGTNDYPDPVLVEGANVDQEEEATTFGGGFSVRFYRKAVLTALATRSRYTSNIPGRDRSVTRFTTGLTFQGDLFR